MAEKAAGSTLLRRSVRAWLSAAFLRLSNRPGPTMVEAVAASRNLP